MKQAGSGFPAVVAASGDELPEGAVAHVTDDDWRSCWLFRQAARPHEFILDLGAEVPVHGFVYVPRPFSGEGRVLEYRVRVSLATEDEGQLAAEGRFSDFCSGFWPDAREQIETVRFREPIIGRYVRFSALSEIGGGDLTAVAEFVPIVDPNDVPFAGVSLALLKGTRYAPSVHLRYEAEPAREFYLELTPERSTPGSYFMACGFDGGYFGIQEQAADRKVVIFSVWDAHAGDNPQAVPEDIRVGMPHVGEGVEARRFGGEGTGGQSFFPYAWELGRTCRFLVRAEPSGDRTAFSAFFFLPETGEWKHLVTFTTLGREGRLTGLYSFVEDFRRDFDSFRELRRAAFGNGFVRTLTGQRMPIVRARFTRDSNPNGNVDAGPAGAGFFLATGGAIGNVTVPLGGWADAERPPERFPTDLPE